MIRVTAGLSRHITLRVERRSYRIVVVRRREFDDRVDLVVARRVEAFFKIPHDLLGAGPGQRRMNRPREDALYTRINGRRQPDRNFVTAARPFQNPRPVRPLRPVVIASINYDAVAALERARAGPLAFPTVAQRILVHDGPASSFKRRGETALAAAREAGEDDEARRFREGLERTCAGEEREDEESSCRSATA